MSRARIIRRCVLIALVFLAAFVPGARAGILQDRAVQVASVATGMPSTTWQLDVTPDVPDWSWGYWQSDQPRIAHVVPLSFTSSYTLWCMIIVHEAWHVRNGNGDHSSDPNNILYPVLLSPTNYVYPPCKEEPHAKREAPASLRRVRRPDRWPGHESRKVLR